MFLHWNLNTAQNWENPGNHENESWTGNTLRQGCKFVNVPNVQSQHLLISVNGHFCSYSDAYTVI